MNTKIGINSPQIKDFGGAIGPCEVEIIELGLDRMNFLDEQKKKNYCQSPQILPRLLALNLQFMHHILTPGLKD